jgi:Mg2+ and Co2+ transporter CorA
MNILLPFEENPYAFWLVLGAMVLIVAAMLGFFKWRKWF